MPDPIIRAPLPSARTALLALMDAYIVDFYRSPRPPAADLERLMDVLTEGVEGTQLVAEVDGALAGFATLYFTWSTLNADRVAILNDLYVGEGARGAGVAAPLFQAALALSRERGCVAMEWQTATDNFRAQKF